MKLRVITGAMLPGLLLGAFAANAAEAPAKQTAQQETQDVMVSGVKVAIDPKTGHIRPMTEAESKQLSDAMVKSPSMKRTLSARGRASTQPRTMAEARSTSRVLANGTKAVRIPDSMMSEISVSLDAKGKPVFTETNAGGSQVAPAQQTEAVQ
jgi:hypothetical protein